MDIVICGYSDRLSASTGETIAFKVSSRAAVPYTARLVRIIHADVNPAGPGLKVEDLSSVFSGTYPSTAKPLSTGSYVRVDDVAARPREASFRVGATILATATSRGRQCVLSQGVRSGGGFELAVDANGLIGVVDGTSVRHDVGLEGAWHHVALVVGPARIALEFDGVEVVTTARAPLHDQPRGTLLIGACAVAAGVACYFNGRIEAPFLDVEGGLSAHWDFALGMGTLHVFDTGPAALHGRLVNLPTRAMRSSTWTGREMCWRSDPSQYAAIHFHDDDFHDAGWSTDFTFTVPDTLKSASYAIEVSVDGAVDWLPFWVSAAPGTATAAIVVVVPTYTYLAYANFARGNFDAALRQRVADWGAYPHNPDEHPEVGLSTYNRHSDGSGVMFSSRWRPMLTMRPGFLTFNDPRGSGCRHYIADHYLIDWLEHEGFAYDVVTDDDVERHGSALLASYATALTGTHPEYHTANTLDAFQGFLDQGGHLAYLGGNGFYWRIGLSDDVPGALEMRRVGGTRAWAAQPGEEFNALDGYMGGLWRNSDRPPNKLVGIGFTSQGNFEGSYYRTNPDARAQPGGWILDGMADKFGDYGLSGGGAAGFELDSICYADGSPRTFTLLARSEGHGPAFGPAHDALLSHQMTLDRGDPATLIRSEIVYFDLPSGGSVFSIGSITFCGALSHDDYCNDVATMMRNYLMHVTR
jgi:N,N-dimethylformamidase